MSNIIDSIKLSGTVYTLSAQTSGGGNPTVELTQAEYDALVSAGTVSADTYYIITDATPVDMGNYWTSAQTNSAINQATSGKQDTLVSGTNIKTINNTSLLGSGNIDIQGGGGGGKAIEGGRGITVTTGETADTISFSLPISAGTGHNTLLFQGGTQSSNAQRAVAFGQGIIKSTAHNSAAFGNSYAEAQNAFAEGSYCHASGNTSHAEGSQTTAYTQASHTEGNLTEAKNFAEHASGSYNNSVSASTTFGDSGNTLFSVGNGTSNNARHNAFEIRQNGDIYISSGGTDIKLQDNLGGGSITIDPTLDSGSTNPVANSAITTAINAKADTTAVTQSISEAVSGKSDTTAVTQSISEAVSGKADTSAVTAVQDSLSGYVTTDTQQNITGNKTFICSSDTRQKPIIFKQVNNSHKIGFSCQNSASVNNELATFEFRPDTYTDGGGVKHPLLYIGHYRTSSIANAGVVQTMVGFRQYDQKGAAAYHYLMPLPAEAKTPFSLTTSFKNYFAPLGFKNGSTMITTDNTGVADFSDVLGGLKLVKLTQSAYDALSPDYDSNTLYVIVN